MVVPFPDIPLDIARLLFETAAWEHPPTAYSLALVSKVVRRWIDPLLYYSVTLGTSASLVAFHHSITMRHNDAFFSRTVKVLCIGSRTSGTLGLPSDIYPVERIWACVRAVLDVCTGAQRLALWLIDREEELCHLPVIHGGLRPTHMSLLDLTDYGFKSRQECVEILPSSLTHLNLDCENYDDFEDIPWQEIFSRWDLFSLVVAPLIPDLPDAITTLGIFTMVPSEEVDLPVFQTQLDLITNATDRIVVVAEDISLRGQLSGLYVFEDGHKYDAEWGSWRGEDTWDIIEKGVADRKRKRHDQRNTGV
ncbi:hypothetical protein CPB85DRAFT_1301133 [Mucidula mucida]|nr:hypothetical protein CPB85DRAFT_1301133 [Mucidula mucida]